MSVECHRAAKASDLAHALDLIEQRLGRDGADYFAMRYERPGHRAEWVQVAVAEGEVVGALDLTPRQMRMGCSLWDVAVFGLVCTDESQPPEVAQALVAQARDVAADLGCVAATALGDPRVHAEAGFVPVRPSYATVVPLAHAPESNSPVVVRKAEPNDIDSLAELQARCVENRSWSLVRDPEWWQWQRALWEADDALAGWRFFSSGDDFLLAEREGELVGYAKIHAPKGESFLLCTEIELVQGDPEVAAALLARLRQRAAAAEREDIRFPAPRSHPFIAQIFDVASLHTVRPAAASIMCTLSLAGALQSMTGELGRRLADSRFAGRTGHMGIGVGAEQVQISMEAGQIATTPCDTDDDACIEVAEKAGAQMLAGYRGVPELRAAGQIEGADEDLALLDALFPQGEPFTWGADLLY